MVAHSPLEVYFHCGYVLFIFHVGVFDLILEFYLRSYAVFALLLVVGLSILELWDGMQAQLWNTTDAQQCIALKQEYRA